MPNAFEGAVAEVGSDGGGYSTNEDSIFDTGDYSYNNAFDGVEASVESNSNGGWFGALSDWLNSDNSSENKIETPKRQIQQRNAPVIRGNNPRRIPIQTQTQTDEPIKNDDVILSISGARMEGGNWVANSGFIKDNIQNNFILSQGKPIPATPGWYADNSGRYLFEIKADSPVPGKGFLHGWSSSAKMVQNLWYADYKQVYTNAIYRYEIERDRVSYLTRTKVPGWIATETKYKEAKRLGNTEQGSRLILQAYVDSLLIKETYSGSSNVLGDIVSNPGRIANDAAKGTEEIAKDTAQFAGRVTKPMLDETIKAVGGGVKTALAETGITNPDSKKSEGSNSLLGSSFIGNLPIEIKVLGGMAAIGGIIWIGSKVVASVGDAGWRYNRSKSEVRK